MFSSQGGFLTYAMLITEKQSNKLTHYDETKKRAHNSQIVRVKGNLKYLLWCHFEFTLYHVWSIQWFEVLSVYCGLILITISHAEGHKYLGPQHTINNVSVNITNSYLGDNYIQNKNLEYGYPNSYEHVLIY